MVSQYRLHAVVKSVKVSLYGCLGRASLVGAWRRGGEPFSTDVVLVLAGVVHKVAYFSLFLIFFLFPFTHCWLFSLSWKTGKARRAWGRQGKGIYMETRR